MGEIPCPFSLLVQGGVDGSGKAFVSHCCMVSAGANVNIRGDSNETPLMFAASNNSTDMLRALLAAKADVTLTNDDGYTALMIAAQHDSNECLKALIDAHADVNATTPGGLTALMLAA